MRREEAEVDSVLCVEKHSRVNERLKDNKKLLERHGDRIDSLEQYQSRFEAQLRHLIEKIDSLIGVMKWFILGLLASAGSFIIWYIQQI